MAFLDDNVTQIIISIVAGIVIGFIFYRLQRKDVVSGIVERVKRAKSELLDIIESRIINKEEIGELEIINLIHSSEREYGISLSERTNVVCLLEDVAFRLQRSRHLGVAEKADFSRLIQNLINEILDSHRPVSVSVQSKLDVIENVGGLISEEKLEEAQIELNNLKDMFQTQVKNEHLPAMDSIGRWQVLTSSMIGIITTILTLFSIVQIDSGRYSIEIGSSLLGSLVVIGFAIVYRHYQGKSYANQSHEKE